MSHADYAKLIDRLHEIKKIPPPPSRHHKCDLVIDGTAFTLLPSGDGDDDVDAVAYFADFGPLPKERAEFAAIRLLEANLFMFGRNAPSFCTNPETGRVLLAGRMPLERVTAESALQLLSVFADHAAEWRASHFLTPEEQQPVTAARSATAHALRQHAHAGGKTPR